MFILQVNTSILSELLETRPSGGCIQPPAFIYLCILTFSCPLKTLNSWENGNRAEEVWQGTASLWASVCPAGDWAWADPE